MSKRLTREEARRQTREALLSAASDAFAANGVGASPVDEIAGSAGFSSGALYSNFEGKDDLLLAVLEGAVSASAQLHRAAAAGASGDASERVEAVAANWLAALRDDPASFVLIVELWCHAVRRPEIRGHFALRYEHVRAALGEIIEASARSLNLQLRVSPQDLAVLANALADGYALQLLVDPDGTDDAVFLWGLQQLFESGVRPR